MNELNNKIDDLINHLVIREGDGPNGSGGEMRYWKDGRDIPAAQAIQALITEQVRLGRIEAYSDCASKGGTGTTVRMYAESRAEQLKDITKEEK